MARNRLTYDELLALESDKGLSLRDSIIFQCFSPQGCYAELKAAHDAVDAIVDELGLPNGALLAYGDLNDYPRKQLFRLLDRKRFSSIDYRVTLSCVRRAIEKAHAFVVETAARFKAEGGILETARHEGRCAALQGLEGDANPYGPPTGLCACSWRKGWREGVTEKRLEAEEARLYRAETRCSL